MLLPSWGNNSDEGLGDVIVVLKIYLYLYVMTTMTLQVPDVLEKEHDETVRFLAAKLYEADKLSLSQAADMCGMRKWNFAEILANYGVHYLDSSISSDLNNV
ncbi:uncharacterized protein UPF0175 [Mucilaginibacter gracilis]|uniref:Uncharacterized protein UPF0175 n=1 Tax=Mucilaginibacter gracilis TaxID=423350 RepID=A0A495J428_9SPHI|nr:UPF0175 family protein [Mucilaginibacter gracilis]RKR82749.1 uncharacterized protein UPF0175 [Mucilaginibacter gracilis]